ncbi:MAG: hypothetical protein ACI4IK_02935 [Eubacterium sp.]
MFPHTITIYHHDIVNNADKYTKQIVSGVYVQEQYGVTKSGHGQQNSRSVTITTNKSLCDNFSATWTIAENDRVIIGIGNDIEKFSDIPKAYTITSITINKCGSAIDNIVMTGV